jgi:transposase
LIVRASANGSGAATIACLLAADQDTVRVVIHAFNDNGLTALDPHWGPGRPRRITAADEAYIVQVATKRPGNVGRPFTHWSLRKLADYLSTPGQN